MYELAKFFLDNSKVNKSDYASKYEELIKKVEEAQEEVQKEIVTPEEVKKVCPRCGAELVLRVAKKGANEGKEFYGCSAFPKCKYIENL